jgi:hypothetical protein
LDITHILVIVLFRVSSRRLAAFPNGSGELEEIRRLQGRWRNVRERESNEAEL